ncbi:acetate/propionate family kinase [Paracoccus sp. MKU1]|uniref:acetate/propionate family kinase n=1 Tax=Paracoccus sp. MKU1 TaxID=1745182 RepID=UPI00071935EC|nr:acetate/propionate family kinase [Paracoccus sp. MKU1]KRW96127.1 acetate kinase [Paracoccus sp. MKU1]
MIAAILTLNAGSSSLKFRVFARESLALLARGAVSRIGADAELVARLADGPEIRSLVVGGDHAAAMQAVLDFVDAHDEGWRIEAVAHRIVHGGTRYTRSTPVTPKVLDDLRELIPLAPLHQPHGLAAIAAARRLVGEAVPNLACFDTAFHAGRDPLFTHFALPEPLFEQGVRRYGFHGLSYQWLAQVLARDHPELHRGRVVAAHLGNGASLCAMRQGRSVDTTMGMTAVDGIPMGTRSGAVDPGAILLMQRSFGMAPEEIEDLIYNRSGLLGMSGRSNDVAALLTDGSAQSRFALDYFALKCAQAAAAMAVSLGGIDAMVFTGGIGENAAPMREAILRRMAPLGDFVPLVIPANEERMMAMEAAALLA